MKLKNKTKKYNIGFSLIELIVVIAIMAVLMGILIPTLVVHTNQSKRSVDVEAAGELAGSFQRVFASNDELYYQYMEDGVSNYCIIWNSSTDISSFDSDPFAKEVFDDYGTLPVSKWKKNLTWKITFNSDDASIHIYLIDSISDTTGYELYPDFNPYVKNKTKKTIV